jgi:hypothetical protein
MCGGGGDQTVTQKTELDPAMRRLLYGGTAANPRGGGGGQGGGNQYNNSDSDGTAAALQRHHELFPSSAPGSEGLLSGGGVDGYGNFGAVGDYFGGAMATGDSSISNMEAARENSFAMGGPVMPQQGLASLNQGQMPMMNGQMPNLSDPMTAATLAMAVRSPQMRYGSIMAQPNPMMAQPMQGYAMGGYIEGPGTGTSDSIPARIYQGGVPVQEAALSDGEFVMTKDAVDGAGGAAAMYAHMRKFENGGTA